MKMHRSAILSFAVALAVPQLAGAKLTMTPEALGRIEGTLDFCAKADADNAAKYKEREKGLVADATKEELDKARSSGDYKESYDSISSKLEKVAKEQAVKACTDFLAGK
jgi:hypothetical protein